MARKKNLNVKDVSIHVPQRDKIKNDLKITPRSDLTPKQNALLDIILNKDNKVIFVDGPAGTSKTYLGVYAGLQLLNTHRVSDLIYVRTIVESASKSLGSLPGESGEKFEPFIAPLKDKLYELLPNSDITYLFKDGRIQPKPINFLRGSSINAQYVLIDEAQNFDFKELTTTITRIGQFSKFIFVGDTFQSDLNGRSGFKKMFDIFDDEESKKVGIVTFKFNKDDIVRSGILKFIIEKIENNAS